MKPQFEDYPENLFEANENLLKIAAMWPHSAFSTKCKRVAYLAYKIFCTCISVFIYAPMEILYFGQVLDDLDVFIEHCGSMLSQFLVACKLFVWYYMSEDINFVLKSMHDDNYKYESCGDYHPGSLFRKNKKFNKFLTIFFSTNCLLVPLSHIFAVGYDFIMLDVDDSDNNTIDCRKFLPYFSIIPFSTETKKGCGFGILFQTVCTMVFSIQICACDTLLLSILNYMKIHFVTLQGAFKTIKERCSARLKVNVSDDTENELLEKAMYIEIRKTTIHLQGLIKLRDKIEGVFTIVILMQTMGTLFILVTCLYMISNVPVFSDNFIAQSQYIVAILVEFGFYAWFGNEFTVASEGILESLYHTDWLSASQRFKKCIIINMLRMKKPLYITIGKFGPLTLTTFVAVVKGSYSYYAVLNQKKAEM